MMSRTENGKRTDRRGAAFTLIELLVVVAIIALLISILLPSLNAARNAAKKAKCMANLSGIGKGLFLYADDNRQQLPDYKGIGQCGFRVAPGRRLTMRVPGSTMLSPYPESYGVGAMLHTGSAPRELPNGLAIGRDCAQPLYYPGDSKGWICPANPGPTDRQDWKNWGNTYAYRKNSAGAIKRWKDDEGVIHEVEDPEVAARVYNVDWLSRGRARYTNPLIWDSVTEYPGDPGFRGPFEYTIAPTFRQSPHKLAGWRGEPTQFWIAFYVGGHCQVNAMNK